MPGRFPTRSRKAAGAILARHSPSNRSSIGFQRYSSASSIRVLRHLIFSTCCLAIKLAEHHEGGNA
jgi:hypothetical protein